MTPRRFHLSLRNLFCLRYDLHLGGFEQAQFVVVPKGGNLVVHFFRRSEEAANLFHNVGLYHKNHLSPEALYARFAWALTKIIKESELDPESFKFIKSEGENRTPEASSKMEEEGRKRKCDDTGEGNGEVSDNREHCNNTSGTQAHGPRRPRRRHCSLALIGADARESNSRSSFPRYVSTCNRIVNLWY
jgi:hypothetical protein